MAFDVELHQNPLSGGKFKLALGTGHKRGASVESTRKCNTNRQCPASGSCKCPQFPGSQQVQSKRRPFSSENHGGVVQIGLDRLEGRPGFARSSLKDENLAVYPK